MSQSVIEEIFSIDELIGESQPVFKFLLKGQTYEAFASNDLPEKFQLRLLEAETEFAELNDELYPQLQDISQALENANGTLKEYTDKDENVPTSLYLHIRKLQQQETSLNVKLVTPARNAIEAMCKLEKGTLSFLPIKATNTLYSKIMDSLYKSAETPLENALGDAEGKAEEATENASEPTVTASEKL